MGWGYRTVSKYVWSYTRAPKLVSATCREVEVYNREGGFVKSMLTTVA